MPEITVQGLSKTFGSERALHDVTFTVSDHEFLTLLGPSGCGKTTTLMSIAGFQQPDTGRIACGPTTFFSADAHVAVPAEQRNLGMVFQSYAVWPHMTVAENVAFPLKVRKLAKQEIADRVLKTLALVEMSPYAARYPHEISGGQQQRVALARALVYSPSVLLLDEPFSNLDAKLRERARTWLKHLQETLGLTTVFVTHDQDEALSMSDRILVMDHGVILQDGTPEEVYHQPTSRFVAEFLGHCNILTGRVVSRAGGGLAVTLSPGGAELIVELGDLTVGDEVEIAVRPEAIDLGDAAAADGVNAFIAEVHSTAFLGDHYVYEIQVEGLALTATSTQPLRGGRVRVRISPSACRVLGHTSAGEGVGPKHEASADLGVTAS
jgi:iron(III) transport system ATP-binding protein